MYLSMRVNRTVHGPLQTVLSVAVQKQQMHDRDQAWVQDSGHDLPHWTPVSMLCLVSCVLHFVWIIWLSRGICMHTDNVVSVCLYVYRDTYLNIFILATILWLSSCCSYTRCHPTDLFDYDTLLISQLGGGLSRWYPGRARHARVWCRCFSNF